MEHRLAVAALLVLGLASGASATLPKFPFIRPNLTYAFNATEPSIDGETNLIHWTRQANAAMLSLNNLLANNTNCTGLQTRTLPQLLAAVGDPQTPASCVTGLQRFAGSFANHALFFLHNLAPYKSQTYTKNASSSLKRAVNAAFGNYTNFQVQFTTAANGVFGSGWAWLIADFKTKKLSITATPNQDSTLMSLAPVKGYPILGLDVWEHAYWTKYKNVRANYTAAFYDVINWKGVSAAYNAYYNAKSPFNVLKPVSI